jgi:hypothetical protein
MLPILRILPVGGVFLAIMILLLALGAPGGSRPSLTPAVLPARGALMRSGEHPEWRQFLILAATRRAVELNRLHELPGKPGRVVAGLPTERGDADADIETGTIADTPSATIPVDIGEPSTFELPVNKSEEKPPVVKTPERGKPQKESRRKGAPRTLRARAPGNREAVAQVNPFDLFFGGTQIQQPATRSRQIRRPAASSRQPEAQLPIVNADPH